MGSIRDANTLAYKRGALGATRENPLRRRVDSQTAL